ncbi:DUF7537 family lipoprotein [Halorientalis halophila]|uniref:DUF7537 family lipoprotein n=1 Tax=Halorientalis halophila TaxID=3108499 RepID=UPI00300BF6A5
MNRTTVALLAVVAAVALAGCGGLVGDSGPQTDQSPANATDGTPETPQTVETDGPYDLPLNGTEVLERHRAALIDAGTFQFRRTSTTRTVEPSRIVQYRNVTATVDEGNGTYRATHNVTGSPLTEIYAGSAGTAYLRQRIENQTAYDRQNRTGNGSESYLTPRIRQHIDGFEYSYEGTESVDNETVHVYAAAERAELSVTEDGRIRSFRYDTTGTNSEGIEFRYIVDVEYRNVGDTTVRSPIWLGQANAVTSD